MNTRPSVNEQELGHRTWTIVELFYRAHQEFREQFESYEQQVCNYSKVTGTPRTELRLNSDELAGLLDLKSMERLRDEYIHPLKDLCHLVFRGQDQTDLLDRYVSDIFHEISILKEQHYNVKKYAPLYERDAAEVELRYILDEAHNRFPQELNHIRYLFGRAQARLEHYLPRFRSSELFIRSLYCHRADFVANAYDDGLDHFYRGMYPLGPFEGYYRVGQSFYHGGFLAEALEAFEAAEATYHGDLLAPERTSLEGGDAFAEERLGEEPAPQMLRREAADYLRSIRTKVKRIRKRLAHESAGEDKIVSLGGLAPRMRGRGKGA